MSIIKGNPFRVLGLLGNSSEREIQKQLGIIKRYAEINKVKSFEYDFLQFGDVLRDIDNVTLASSRIERSENKLLYSLFWFVNESRIDAIALNNLNENKNEKAIEIWEKMLKDEVSNKNFSAYLNLSTVYISLAVTGNQLVLPKLLKGIVLKGKLLQSDAIGTYSNLIVKNYNIIDSLSLSKKFIDEIILLLTPFMENSNVLSPNILLNLFNSYPEEIRQYLSSKYTEAPLSSIELKIDQTASNRKKNPSCAEEYGEHLYYSTDKDLYTLRNLLGLDNVQYKLIVNNLTNEMLQCSIDYFNYFRDEDGEIDPGNYALKIAKFAESLGSTGQAESRVEESLKVIQDWVDDEPNRQKHSEIENDFKAIGQAIDDFQNKRMSTSSSRILISTCKPKLINIKMALGLQDEYYIQACDAVVNNSLGMLVALVNQEQDSLLEDRSRFDTLKQTISSADSIISDMSNMDMSHEMRSRLNTNKTVISGLNIKLQEVSAKKDSSGCYIATMAYGDYNHPQVIKLRKFRDGVLLKTKIGRPLVRCYYLVSPYLVQILKDQKRTNSIIRKILDVFIKGLKS